MLTKLIRALNVAPVYGLWKIIVMVYSPMRDLCSHFMARYMYIVSGSICHTNLLSQILYLVISS